MDSTTEVLPALLTQGNSSNIPLLTEAHSQQLSSPGWCPALHEGRAALTQQHEEGQGRMVLHTTIEMAGKNWGNTHSALPTLLSCLPDFWFVWFGSLGHGARTRRVMKSCNAGVDKSEILTSHTCVK